MKNYFYIIPGFGAFSANKKEGDKIVEELARQKMIAATDRAIKREIVLVTFKEYFSDIATVAK